MKIKEKIKERLKERILKEMVGNTKESQIRELVNMNMWDESKIRKRWKELEVKE